MKTTRTFDASYYASLALQTRKYGHCYIHAAAAHHVETPDGIRFHASGWGRSLQSGGHKYKVHARWKVGEPVPSRVLKDLPNSPVV